MRVRVCVCACAFMFKCLVACVSVCAFLCVYMYVYIYKCMYKEGERMLCNKRGSRRQDGVESNIKKLVMRTRQRFREEYRSIK